MQDEEKQQFAAASLDYNLDHVQLKNMFQKELEIAQSNSQAASERTSAEEAPVSAAQSIDAHTADSAGSSDVPDAPAAEFDSMQINDATQAQSQHAVPASVQSAALDMLQKQLKEGQPEQALLQIEAALKYASLENPSTQA